MKAEFWKQKWERREIAFHEGKANYFLVKHVNQLALAKNSRVFVPLCGKTQDMIWLLEHGYKVIGAELSEIAVKEFFLESKLVPNVRNLGNLVHYQAENIDIYAGDIFDVTHEMLGSIQAIYDRAALVALPHAMRRAYTSHLMDISKAASQLIVSYEYDQNLVDGPPFSISEKELSAHFAEVYELQALETISVIGGLKGKADSSETAWLLTRKSLI
jgi:thiopurine S-methyltransferase